MGYTHKGKKVKPLKMGDSLPSPGPSHDSERLSPRTKPAFQRQCSSPSFVESYARYVERLQQDDQHKQLMQAAGMDPTAQEETIKAAFPADTTAHPSLDLAQGTADSAHKSWPGTSGLLIITGDHLNNFSGNSRFYCKFLSEK